MEWLFVIRPYPQGTVVKAVIRNINVFRTLIAQEHQTLPVRSGKLFTLHTLYNATSMLLADWQTADLEQQIDLAIRYWQAVSYCIPDWEGRIMVKSQISRSRTRVGRMVAYLKGYLGLPLTK